jgi:DNA (cytosine-5)-methyltransferase 1
MFSMGNQLFFEEIMKLTFLDLFAGAGGLSEGFIQSNFEPIAHVELDRAACFTLRTRMAYHWLKANNQEEVYADYLKGTLKRSDFYQKIPTQVIDSVINAEIGLTTLSSIFQKIDSLLGNRKLDLIVGGPPCQAYSVVGRSRDQNRMKGDKRNYLYIYYAEFLKRYRPSYFVFENVIGLLSASDEEGNLYFDAMRSLFLEYGYETEFITLKAEDYGVLQSRKRIILVGRRGKLTSFYPMPDKWNPGVNVEEIFCDLPSLTAGEGNAKACFTKPYHGTWQNEAGIRNNTLPITWHQARPNTEQDLEIYRIAVDLWNKKKSRLDYNVLPDHLKTHRQRESFLDRFKVVASDLPYSHTVVAHIAKDGHYYIHPDINQNRSITPREAARIQTFPDSYYFESGYGPPERTPTFRQIGNAVPVLLARKIADKLKAKWL